MVPLTILEKSPIVRAVIPTRVLVVDAEPLIRWAICTALKAEGFDPVSAADLAEARRLANEWPPPRVVLFDLTSADPAGVELLLAIRCVYPNCRFVVMTAGSERPPEWLLRQGVQWFHKPFDLRHVLQVIEDLATRPPQRSAETGRVA